MTLTYDDQTPRHFMIASIVWGIVGMLVGVIIALQMGSWQMNGHFLEIITFGAFKTDGISWLTFGRLRPLHTNAVIFAFVGNMAFSGIYYSTQRLCKCRMASDRLSKIHFWGWQIIILGAAITLPLGLTQSKEYAELIWPLDLAVAGIWVIFAVNFFKTLANRNEPSLYVALWFYIATIVTVAMLYIVNNLQIPTSLTHSYPIFGGLQDALVQWWYGHNAVAFFLTTPILGIMYYFLPKAANRPVYSYRLSIIHFWALTFIYIWAGPHHLLNTALPHWLQTLGMLFSLMLWAPSWGGMLNGLLTLRGGWAQLRTDPVIKFFAAGVTFYGMATFEGPLLSIRAVNELSHYTDWGIGHVHSGALGWNGLMAAGMFYWMAPRLWNTTLYSKGLANLHFWIALVGILLYVAAMWTAGITQGLMLGQMNAQGTALKYEFVETLLVINWPYHFRSFGGSLFLLGYFLLAYNIWQTARSGSAVNGTAEITPLERGKKDFLGLKSVFAHKAIQHVLYVIGFIVLWIFAPRGGDYAAMAMVIIFTFLAVKEFKRNVKGWADFHDLLLENYIPLTVLSFIAVAIGGAVQIIPTLMVDRAKNIEGRLQELYTPLELAGRDIYIAEGCYNCHSQMIRTLVPDIMRYGRNGIADDYSHLGESIYDFPHQWGSKRTGPDLAREGGDAIDDAGLVRVGKKSNSWHFTHFLNPRQTSPGSNMPAYPWFFEEETDFESLPRRIATQQRLGVPYPAMSKDQIEQHAREQAMAIADTLKTDAYLPDQPELTGKALRNHLAERKIIAVIAYLQKLGTYTEQDLNRQKADRFSPDQQHQFDHSKKASKN